ncbi:protein LONGIFOLIA 1-like [Argentina anserina]|uniref:protein LONGIFOLIA 1-like n=1 Tax=Argentina anserina TaxID=57926 RepID=UPI00217675A1|nr:protein LONGIFOLIA 1-like [Potentilla anserina]
MSAKVFHSFRDENREFHKQIGCMSGIFQLFDRRHFLSGRSLNGQSHKRLAAGENGNQEMDPKSRALQKATDKNRKKVVKERRNFTESSTTTVSSSSCSSTFSSSLECNKAAPQEQSSSGQTIYNDRHTQDLSMNKLNASKPLSQQSFDSTYREARGISIRPGGKDGVGHILKYIDSPRPSQPLKPIKPRVSGAGESFQVHAKLREAHRKSNEEKVDCRRFVPKEARRLSYDERASRDAVKSSTKLKEVPRLSLDSKERSTRRACSPETRSNNFFNDLQRENGCSDKMLDLQPETGIFKRPLNVVAKLMGLDLSESVSASVTPSRLIDTCPYDRFDPLSRSSRTTDESKQDVSSGLPSRMQKGFSSPQRRSANSVMKPAANSKFPLETAPWRQPQGSKGSPQSAFICQEEPTKAPKSSPTVYGEMEKRLAELEFKKSGKDLRALKQILEAMQTKENSEDKKEASYFASQVSNNSVLSESTISASKKYVKTGPSLPATSMGSRSPKSYRSPIIIMKPGLVEKTHNSTSTMISMNTRSHPRKVHHSNPVDNREELLERKAKDLTPRNIHTGDSFSGRPRSTDKNPNVRTSKAAHKPKMSQSEESSPVPSRSITSPRLQNRRFGLENQSPTATLSSDSSMTRRQRSRQTLEVSTTGRRLGPKSLSLHQSNCQLSETSTSTRAMSHQDDTSSQQSESNISSVLDADTEATSIHQSDMIRDTYLKRHSQKQNSPVVGLNDDRLTAEPGKASLEQPSPISVLDSTFYRDDSPSPVKKISNAFKDDGQNLEAEYGPMDIGLITSSVTPSLGAEIDRYRLENLKQLILNHRHRSSTHEEPILDHIPLHCDRSNPDRMYISDILVASGILTYLESSWTTVEPHTLDHLINPNFFLALEEIWADIKLHDDGKRCGKILQSQLDDKNQRKLVFDVVNEFLLQKLVVENKPRFSPNKLAEGKPRGQQLLTELCSQVDQLQKSNLNGNLDDEDASLTNILLENFMDQSQNWAKCDGEIPSIVLDVERLIFKDLITEIVSREPVQHAGWSGGHCRQLFSKKGLW